jgi:hypothetical protein
LRTAIDIRSPGFKRYFSNTSWLMGHRVLSMVVALFVGVYVARYLGPELKNLGWQSEINLNNGIKPSL